MKIESQKIIINEVTVIPDRRNALNGISSDVESLYQIIRFHLALASLAYRQACSLGWNDGKVKDYNIY